MKDFLVTTIKKAGDFLLDNFKQEKDLTKKRTSSKEAALEYDEESDKLIRKRIEEKFPDHKILTEENGLKNNDSDKLWIVDSLDGTGNFANHNPLFSVCIAFVEGQQLKRGAVYAPALDELYYAEKEEGAYLNGEEISVSEINKLNDSYVVYCEGNQKDRQKSGAVVNKVYPKVTDQRKIGSAGIETAWTAAGRVDGYWTMKIDPWDVAAGVLLIKEAGGKVTTFEGEQWTPDQHNLICSNGKIHSNLQNLINQRT